MLYFIEISTSGWRLVAGVYIKRITKLLSWIRNAIPHVLSRNRNAVDSYFWFQWLVVMLIDGFQSKRTKLEDGILLRHFEAYMSLEETRIRKNLQKVKYRVDASDTLALVLGPGPLEKARNTETNCSVMMLTFGHSQFSRWSIFYWKTPGQKLEPRNM